MCTIQDYFVPLQVNKLMSNKLKIADPTEYELETGF